MPWGNFATPWFFHDKLNLNPHPHPHPPTHTHRHTDAYLTYYLFTFCLFITKDSKDNNAANVKPCTVPLLPRRSLPLLPPTGPLQPELPWRRGGLPGARRGGGQLRPAVRRLESRLRLVQRGLAERRLRAVPHHQPPWTLRWQQHRPRPEELRDARQEQAPLRCLLLHLQIQRWDVYFFGECVNARMRRDHSVHVNSSLPYILEQGCTILSEKGWCESTNQIIMVFNQDLYK